MTAFESISMHLLWGLKDDLLETLEKSPPHTKRFVGGGCVVHSDTLNLLPSDEGCDAYRMRIASS